MQIGQRIRSFREENSLSLEDLASRLGVSRTTVLRWENGSAKPTLAVAEKLKGLGFGSIDQSETNHDEIPQIRRRTAQLELFAANSIEPVGAESHTPVKREIALHGKLYNLKPAPYVDNGPRSQLSFFEHLYELQTVGWEHSKLSVSHFAERLSAVASVEKLASTTSQFRLESPKKNAAHWNANYGPHGWHRYIGRFPPHLVRGILNHFGATNHHVVLDPFLGSGTTLVECRLLGIPGVGVEICPLSSLISSVKCGFPSDVRQVTFLAHEFADFYKSKWDQFARKHGVGKASHNSVLDRPGNILAAFSNIEKWLTPAALLGVSIVLEFASQQQAIGRDIMLFALSSKMRSIGNIDVDVARAEYSKHPRENVDVLALVSRVLKKISDSIVATVSSHSETIASTDSQKIIHGDIREIELPESSVDYVITSPPYGVEASSYLRAHLLSYRCLYPFLKEDPYEFGSKVIGSEYVSELDGHSPDHSVSQLSPTFERFFQFLNNCPEHPGGIVKRAHMMMQFFADINGLIQRLTRWMKRGGRVAFVIGNKKIGDLLVPTSDIVVELFESHGFKCSEQINHKLKCNNSNSQVPWQERVIQDEFVLFFTRMR